MSAYKPPKEYICPLDHEVDVMREINLRYCKKCCGNCRHFIREYESTGCGNDKIGEISFRLAGDRPDIALGKSFYGYLRIDEGFVCDLWEKSEEKGEW